MEIIGIAVHVKCGNLQYMMTIEIPRPTTGSMRTANNRFLFCFIAATWLESPLISTEAPIHV